MVFGALFRRTIVTRSVGVQVCDPNWHALNTYAQYVQKNLTQSIISFGQCQKYVNDNVWMEVAERLMDLLDGKLKELDTISRKLEQEVMKAQQTVEEKRKNLKLLQKHLFDMTRDFIKMRKDTEWEAWDKKQLQNRYRLESEIHSDLKKDKEAYRRKLVFVENRVVIVENQVSEAEVYLDEMLKLRTTLNEGHFTELIKYKDDESGVKLQKIQLQSFQSQGGHSPDVLEGFFVKAEDLKLMREEALSRRIKLRTVNQILQDQNEQCTYLDSVNSLLKDKVSGLHSDLDEEKEKYRHIKVSKSLTDANGETNGVQKSGLRAIMPRDEDKISTASLPAMENIDTERDDSKALSSSGSSKGSYSNGEGNMTVAPPSAVDKLRAQASPSGLLARLKSFTFFKN